MTQTLPIHPNSMSSRDVARHLHPQTDLVGHREKGAFTIVSGDGVRVTDDDGAEYIDAMAGLWSAALGYSENRLAKAAYDQLCELPYTSTFAQRTHPKVIELSERLVSIAPAGLTRAFFACSGSEVIDTAAKIVWAYWNARGRPEKKKLIARDRAYHGSTIVSGSLTGLPRMHALFDLPVDRIVRAPCPHYWKNAHKDESEDVFTQRMGEELAALIDAEGADTIGAFFAEPIQGAGGVIVPSKGYFDEVQALCDAHDILFIADEVICGFGRTGTMWGSEHYNLQPDMVTCAKALSASYAPIAALLMNDDIYDGLLEHSRQTGLFGHGFTYSGHPMAAAVALEALKIYEELDIVSLVQERAPALQNGLAQFSEHPIVGEVRGVGLLAGVELCADRSARTTFDPALSVGVQVQEVAKENGVLVRALGDTLAFCPPMIISEEDIRHIVSVFGAALDSVYKGLDGV